MPGHTDKQRSRAVRGTVILGCLLAALTGIVCFLLRAELPSRSFPSMGTLATVTLGAADADRIEPATAQVRALFERLEAELSVYRPDSTISRMAAQAGAAPVSVSDDAVRLLSLAKRFGELSDGAFDVTVAPVVKLWSHSGASGTAVRPSQPSADAIRELLPLVDYRRMILANKTASLSRRGMAVDLGGIAKGYAVDRAYEYCRGAGIEDFLIDLGGNVRVSGRPRWGEDWEVGVRDPFDRSRIIGKVTLPTGMALATSGSYERFVEIGGQRFSHIVDPRTGYPVAGTAGVTVLCSNAVTADALSTAFFVVGLQAATKLLERMPAAELLIIPDKYPVELWLTSGFEKAFVPIPERSGSLHRLTPHSP